MRRRPSGLRSFFCYFTSWHFVTYTIFNTCHQAHADRHQVITWPQLPQPYVKRRYRTQTFFTVSHYRPTVFICYSVGDNVEANIYFLKKTFIKCEPSLTVFQVLHSEMNLGIKCNKTYMIQICYVTALPCKFSV